MRSPKRIVKLAMVAALAILVAGGIRAARRATETQPLLGVTLGMTADEVRSQFRPPASGFFMIGSEGGEPLLVWRPRGRPDDAPTEARFEFEDGALLRARFAWPPGTTAADAQRQLHVTDEARVDVSRPPGHGPVITYGR